MTKAFFDWFEQAQPALEKWGAYVVDTIEKRVQSDVGAERFATFFKIEPSFRVKSEVSAQEKIARKAYDNPREQMTDLVGVRFIVLLKSDLEVLERAIINRSTWAVSKERDFFNESLKEPSVFDYQSNHYLLTNTSDREIDGILIPEGVRCEVQTRSLLQHAYAELVHADVYKTDSFVPSSTKRLVARSMALMESTDEVFVSISKEIESIRKAQSCLYSASRMIYLDMGVAQIPEEPSDLFLEVFETYRYLTEEVSLNALSEMMRSPALRLKITERVEKLELFADPTTVLVYWLVQNKYNRFFRDWPRPDLRRDLEQVASDLGKAFPD